MISLLPRRVKDLTGERMGKWTVLAFSHTDKWDAYWQCRCDCGNERVIKRTTFRTGGSKGCGCDPHPTNFIELAGQRYGRLLVLAYAYHKNGGSRWHCLCDCGALCVAYGSHLKAGTAQSCGCYRKEKTARRLRTHGRSRTSLYAVWNSMKARCTNPKNSGYLRYGAKGVKVCERWIKSFVAFLKDVGEPPTTGHQLDRIDPQGNYEPGNIRWVVPTVNNRNKTNNRTLQFNGERLCVTEWAEKLGLTPACLYGRLNAGWTVEKTLTTPRGPTTNKG